MKLTYYTACALFAGLFAASCSSSDDVTSDMPADSNTITANVTFTTKQPQSRVAIGGQVSGGKLSDANFYWSAKDKIRLYAPEAAVDDVKKKRNNMTTADSLISEDRKSATFKSSKNGLNIALGKDTYLVLAQNWYGDPDSFDENSGVSLDEKNPNILKFTCEDKVNAILGSDNIPIDFFSGSIFTEYAKIPGADVKWNSSTNSVNLSGSFKVLTPVLCFQLPEGTTANEFTYKNLEWSGATYNMSTGEWTSSNNFVNKTIGITTAIAGVERNRIVYVPVLPGSINDDASITCDGYTCSLKGLKSQLSEENNIVFLGVLGQSSHWVKDATK